MATLKLTVVLPHKVSNNTFYRTHFHLKSSIKNDFYRVVQIAVKQSKLKPILDYPANFVYEFHNKGRLLDLTNYGASVKMLEDGLKECGILKDDSPKFVSRITITAEKTTSPDFVNIYY